MEIGFRPLRFGQSANGDHWKHGSLHYFLHDNRSASNRWESAPASNSSSSISVSSTSAPATSSS